MKSKELLLLIALILSVGCAMNTIWFMVYHAIVSLEIATALSFVAAIFAALGVREGVKK